MAKPDYDDYQAFVNKTTGERVFIYGDGTIRPAPPLEGGLAPVFASAGYAVDKVGNNIERFFADDLERAAIEEEMRENAEIFKPIADEYPVRSFVGGAVPSFAVPGVGGGSKVASAINASIGGLDAYLQRDAGDHGLQSAIEGTAVAGVGDVFARVGGRIWNFTRGLVEDAKVAAKQQGARRTLENIENPAAAEAEAAGYRTLASQRLEQGSNAQRGMASASASAESSWLPNAVFDEVDQHNQKLLNSRTAEAIGLPPGEYDRFDESLLLKAEEANTARWQDLHGRTLGKGYIEVPKDVKAELALLRPMKRQLRRGGMKWMDVEGGRMPTKDYLMVRRMLAQEAHGLRSASRPDYESAGYIDEDIAALDDQLEQLLSTTDDPNLLADFRRAREFHRNFEIVQKPNVIKGNQVRPLSLDNALKAKTGYGLAGRTGQGGHLEQTQNLIRDARVLSDKSLQRKSDSGTGVRTSNRDAAEAAGDVIEGLTTGNFGRSAGGLLRLHTPIFAGMAEAGGAHSVGGLFGKSPTYLPRAGALGARILNQEGDVGYYLSGEE